MLQAIKLEQKLAIIEALLYHYIECASAKDPTILSKVKTTEHKHVQDLGTINRYISSSGHEFCMHKIEELDFVLTERTNLSVMINFCYDTGLIGRQLRDGIQYAQEKRNQIHLKQDQIKKKDIQH